MDSNRVVGSKRIDATRRTVGAPNQQQATSLENNRPNSLIGGSANNIYCRDRLRKGSSKKFIPLTTVQIRAYEFANLKVSGEAPSLLPKIQNKDILSFPISQPNLPRKLQQKQPQRHQNSNYLTEHYENENLAEVEGSLYLEKDDAQISNAQVPRVSALLSSRKASVEAYQNHIKNRKRSI